MLFMVLGIIFLLLRIYLIEFRMVNLLKTERRYFSRTSSYLLAGLLITEFKSLTLKLSLFLSIGPFTFIFLLTDVPFFENFGQIMLKNKISNKADQMLLFIERITLHFPIILTGYILLFNNPNYFFVEYGFWPFIYSFLILVVPFLVLDPRWKDGSILGRIILLHFLVFLGIAYMVFTFLLK
jgi:hypothetical protein